MKFDRKFLYSISKTISILLWFSTILICIFILIGQFLVYHDISRFFLGLLLFPLFLFIAFLINIPNLIFIILGNWKTRKNYFYITFVANLFTILLFLILMVACSSNNLCTSDGPLISGSSVLIYLLIGTFFGSLPFSYLINKLFLRIKR